MEADKGGNGVTTADERQLDLELYKSLRAEAANYVEKIPALWLQKFLLVGAAIAFLTGKDRPFAGMSDARGLMVAGLALVPVLAILLDAKILEYGLHARAISRFLSGIVPAGSMARRWEMCLWGQEGDARVMELVRLRSATTLIVTAVPTAALIVLAGFTVSVVLGAGWHLPLAAFGGAVVYVMATVWFSRRLWPRG